ncbi:LPXTG cell wall anchor domain-containing protein [Bacillus sp. FJAT-45037]|uniref:LPXTG cell wall anchor domain-containing protein n=1 Tax=Bacillus sp. FJAT-45037 TaxID=2011007 RepID=UPI000C248F29|nr:LPXTG cell wall anchor domain-containing protein [Bacillus sp. FJAT-45037]
MRNRWIYFLIAVFLYSFSPINIAANEVHVNQQGELSLFEEGLRLAPSRNLGLHIVTLANKQEESLTTDLFLEFEYRHPGGQLDNRMLANYEAFSEVLLNGKHVETFHWSSLTTFQYEFNAKLQNLSLQQNDQLKISFDIHLMKEAPNEMQAGVLHGKLSAESEGDVLTTSPTEQNESTTTIEQQESSDHMFPIGKPSSFKHPGLEGNHKLPSTSTNMYNFLLIGCLLLIIAGIIRVFAAERLSENRG